MNVFKNTSDIFGQYSSNKVYGSMKKFLKITKKTKKKLREDSYKLDRYLNVLLKSINTEFNANAAAEGTEIYRVLRGIFFLF